MKHIKVPKSEFEKKLHRYYMHYIRHYDVIPDYIVEQFKRDVAKLNRTK